MSWIASAFCYGICGETKEQISTSEQIQPQKVGLRPVSGLYRHHCRYNALVYVPYQLERLLWFGTFICCDSFLVGLYLVNC